MLDTLTAPLRAARELVHLHGVEVDRCDILQNASTLVVRLSESLVARVVVDREGPRGGMAWFARENAVAQHLASLGAPVIPLHAQMPAGPHEHRGFVVNFWQYVTVMPISVPPELMGDALQRCHAALRTFPGQLPRLAILDESLEILGRLQRSALMGEADLNLLRACLMMAQEQLAGLSHQALHGDAHEGNLLATPTAVLWTDWEDTFLGPVEWDLASLIWNEHVLHRNTAHVEAVFAGYRRAGGVFSEAALIPCLMARAAVMCAWYPLLYPQPSAERQFKMQRRLSWLREQIE